MSITREFIARTNMLRHTTRSEPSAKPMYVDHCELNLNHTSWYSLSTPNPTPRLYYCKDSAPWTIHNRSYSMSTGSPGQVFLQLALLCSRAAYREEHAVSCRTPATNLEERHFVRWGSGHLERLVCSSRSTYVLPRMHLFRMHSRMPDRRYS
jgi:hypothetical protein